jgi:hypothetical protein
VPTIDELASINDAYGWGEGKGRVKGGIELSADAVIGDKLKKPRKDGVQELEGWGWTFYFGSGIRTGRVFSENQNRALCVRSVSN